MKDNRMLYQINTLEKIIFRKFFASKNTLEECHPIPPTQVQIMEYIIKNGKECVYQKDLESVLKLRRATVSGVLQTMEKNGLIKRVIDKEDTRTKKVILQQKAINLFNQKEKEMQEIENIIVKGISTEDLNTFSNVLEKMRNNIEKY